MRRIRAISFPPRSSTAMLTAFLVCVALSVAIAVPAQTARQGTDRADPTEFHSPMVLDVDFIAAKPSLWQEKDSDDWVSLPEYARLSRFHCDGVSISTLLLSPRKAKNDYIDTLIKIGTLNTGHDKQVKLLLELFNGETKVAESVLGPIKDKEGATVIQSGSIAVSRADLHVDPFTTLRITMTNWDY